MKKILLLLVLAFTVNITMAQIFQSTSCNVEFFSSTSLEDIKAINKNSTSIINSATGDVVFRVPNSGFKFEKALMEEHFHENYMETSKFPNCEFKGKINEKLDWKKEGAYDVTVTGILKAHGVDKERTIKGKVTIKGDKATIESKFDVPLKDHNIDVPKLVAANLAENMAVTVGAEYAPYVKK